MQFNTIYIIYAPPRTYARANATAKSPVSSDKFRTHFTLFNIFSPTQRPDNQRATPTKYPMRESGYPNTKKKVSANLAETFLFFVVRSLFGLRSATKETLAKARTYSNITLA